GLRGKSLEGRLGGLERNDLGIDAGFAHAPGDELGHLAAEVYDEDGVGMSGAGHGEALEKETSRRNGLSPVAENAIHYLGLLRPEYQRPLAGHVAAPGDGHHRG